MIQWMGEKLTSPPAPMNAAASARPVAQLMTGPASAMANWPKPWLAVFLALRIGVREEAADGEQEDGAEAETKIGSHDEARSFSHEYCRDADEEEPEAAKPAVLSR